MTQDTLNKQDTPIKVAAPLQNTPESTAAAMNAADQAMVDELDRVLRAAFGQQPASAQPPAPPIADVPRNAPTRPVIASKPLPPLSGTVTNAQAQQRSEERSPILEQGSLQNQPIETPVMLPVSGPPSAQTLRPRLGPAAPVASPVLPPKPADATQAQAVAGPQPPFVVRALSQEHAPVDVARAATGNGQASHSASKSVDEQPKEQSKRNLRPLPPVTATIAPVEPIIARRRFPWRPAVAVTAIVLMAAVGGQFVLQWLKQPAIPVSDAPPVITAPVAPTGVAASPEIQSPPPVVAAPVAVPPPVAAVAAPAAEPVVPAAPVSAAPPTVESAGILGTPQVSPFDGAVPTRTVRTTVVAAASAGAQPVVPPAESKPAKPLSLTDKATWPEGASLAEPHPLPPRRK